MAIKKSEPRVIMFLTANNGEPRYFNKRDVTGSTWDTHNIGFAAKFGEGWPVTNMETARQIMNQLNENRAGQHYFIQPVGVATKRNGKNAALLTTAGDYWEWLPDMSFTKNGEPAKAPARVTNKLAMAHLFKSDPIKESKTLTRKTNPVAKSADHAIKIEALINGILYAQNEGQVLRGFNEISRLVGSRPVSTFEEIFSKKNTRNPTVKLAIIAAARNEVNRAPEGKKSYDVDGQKVIAKIKSYRDVPFTVTREVFPYNKGMETVSVYDSRQKKKFGGHGQKVGSWAVDTFVNLPQWQGLNMQGGVPDWTLDANDVDTIRAALAGRKTNPIKGSKTMTRNANPTSAPFNVYLHGKKIDTVFYDPRTFSADEIRQSLVNHDGYDSDIEVRKGRATTRKANPREGADTEAARELYFYAINTSSTSDLLNATKHAVARTATRKGGYDGMEAIKSWVRAAKSMGARYSDDYGPIKFSGATLNVTARMLENHTRDDVKALMGSKATRAKNPLVNGEHYHVVAVKGGKVAAHWTGTDFDTNKAKAKSYMTKAGATNAANAMAGKLAAGYQVGVQTIVEKGGRVTRPKK